MRYKFIDALRGIAALAVLATHVATPLGSWVRWGALGVPVFFVISGFVIAASNADQNITLRYTGRFILRRSLRLDPPYWLTIALMLAYFHTPLSAGAVLANMFYLHVLLRQPNAISVGWTLCQEVQLYLFFIVSIGLIQQLARIAKRDYLIIAMIAQAVLAVISMKLAGHFCGGWFLPYWYQFFAGVLCFWIASGRLAWQYVLAYIAMIALLAIALQTGGDELTRPAAVTVTLVAVTLVAARNALTTLLAGSVWQFLGRISYSLYLTHIPVNDMLRQWIRPGYVLMLVSIPTCLAAATLMYLLVERTAIGWSKSIPKAPGPQLIVLRPLYQYDASTVNNQNASATLYDTSIRLVLLALIVGWCLLILYPFTSMILWGMILAMALAPAHRFLASRMGGRSKLASVFIVSVCLVLIIVPSWLFLDAIIDNVKDAKASFQAGTLTIPPPSEKVKSWPIVGAKLYGLWQLASVDLRDLVVKYKTQLLGLGGTVARGILSFGGGAFQLIIAIFIAGALLATRGTSESVHRIFGKLAGDKGDELAAIIHKTVGKVVKGILGVAFIQSLMIGVGLLLSGVPYAGIWTLVVFLLAVLQIPQFLVVIPAAIYLFSVKSTTVAVLWTIFLMIGGLADNVLKPILLGKGAPVPMLVIFIGVIGGFLLSGLIGLFTGAIVMSVGYTLFQAWLDGDVGAKPV